MSLIANYHRNLATLALAALALFAGESLHAQADTARADTTAADTVAAQPNIQQRVGQAQLITVARGNSALVSMPSGLRRV